MLFDADAEFYWNFFGLTVLLYSFDFAEEVSLENFLGENVGEYSNPK